MARTKRGAARRAAARAPAVEKRPVAAETRTAETRAAERPRTDRLAWVGAAVVPLAVVLLYLPTAARDIVFGDSPELTGVAATLGVAHPPGYPVWTMLAHLFTLLPFETLPFRVALFSIVAGAATCVVICVTAYRLTRSIAASATGALLFAIVPVVWTWSIVPEVFAFADLLAAGLVLAMLLWHQTGNGRYFIAGAFIGGIGMAHHQTIALLGPAILYLMWVRRRDFASGALLVRAAAASAIGLLPYLYLLAAAAAHPAYNWTEISSLSGLWAHVLRFDYGTGALVGDRFQGGAIADRLIALTRSFTVPEAALAAAGAFWLFRRDRQWFNFIAIAFVVAGPAFIAYSNTNLSIAVLQAVLERFFLLAHVIAAPVAAVGVYACIHWVPTLRARRAVLEWGLAALALAAGGAVAAPQLAAIDQSQNRDARAFGNDILASLRPNIIFLESGDPVVGPVEYMHYIEGARPDVKYVDIALVNGDWYVRQLRRLYPTLVLQYDRYDGYLGTMRSLVEANGFQNVDLLGSLTDDSLAANYVLYRRGLVEELRSKQGIVNVDDLAVVNEQALRGYHIPPPSSVASRPWDRLVLADYGLIAYDMGGIYERLKRPADARTWYQRALAIDPDMDEARKALAALPP